MHPLATLLLAGLFSASPATRTAFELVSPTYTATVCVPASEPECVRLAAADLVSDVQQITGRSPAVVTRLEEAGARCVVLASLNRPESAALLQKLAPGWGDGLSGRWEAYRVAIVGTRLIIAGSDERGTMFGLYAFIEKYLGVDPLYYWSARPPARRATLAWDDVAVSAGEPTFRFRGWFINDEDLLTEFRLDGGQRRLDYPYYQRVISPAVSARIFEALLRLQYNTVIPSSFVDLRNPAEARLIEDAVRRGLFVTMHHVEPVGVSAFGFDNFWKDRGQTVPFAYTQQTEKFRETWREYAGRWAKFAPQVIWQLGLRGIADRPVWLADPGVPQSDEGRGRLISEAMAAQWEIIRRVDPRPQPLATTTLWMEGAALHAAGHLAFPPGVAVIFSDNSPGWELQRDFYTVPREPGRPYGIYYHHQLWGSGPHLVQAVPPHKTHAIFQEAVQRGATHYAMLNVSNVREFVLGIDASARMLRDFPAFDPDAFLAAWCAARFGTQAEAAESAYRRLFASFVADPATGQRALLDGECLHAGVRLAKSLATRREAGGPGDGKTAGLLKKLRGQREQVEQAGADADRIAAQLDGPSRLFFESNFLAQQQIMLGLLRWVEQVATAHLALDRGDRAAVAAHVRALAEPLALIAAGQALASRGAFQDWYRGDRKMNLAQLRAWTEQLAADRGPPPAAAPLPPPRPTKAAP